MDAGGRLSGCKDPAPWMHTEGSFRSCGPANPRFVGSGCNLVPYECREVDSATVL
jgi:hypothetical protein